jgi:hypothetical protein
VTPRRAVEQPLKHKRLTATQFEAAVSELSMGERTRRIAYGVLVEGRSQHEFVTALRITKGAVSQAVNRVWEASEHATPGGLQRVTALLPPHQAFIVKQWEKEAMKKKGHES